MWKCWQGRFQLEGFKHWIFQDPLLLKGFPWLGSGPVSALWLG